MDLLTYILLHFTNDKCRIEPYAQSRKWDIYKALLAYLNYLGWDLQQKDKNAIKEYLNTFFETIEKELDRSSS